MLKDFLANYASGDEISSHNLVDQAFRHIQKSLSEQKPTAPTYANLNRLKQAIAKYRRGRLSLFQLDKLMTDGGIIRKKGGEIEFFIPSDKQIASLVEKIGISEENQLKIHPLLANADGLAAAQARAKEITTGSFPRSTATI